MTPYWLLRREGRRAVAYIHTCNIFHYVRSNRPLSFTLPRETRQEEEKQRKDNRDREKREHQTIDTKHVETINKKKINNPKNIQRGKHTGDELPVFYCICCCPVQGKKGRAGGQTKRFCKTGKLDELDQVGKIPK